MHCELSQKMALLAKQIPLLAMKAHLHNRVDVLQEAMTLVSQVSHVMEKINERSLSKSIFSRAQLPPPNILTTELSEILSFLKLV
jgi:hypothetical protein